MDSKVFGEFIAKCRKEKNMTQAELANLIGVTDKAVSRWERGKGFPDIQTLEPLSQALDISLLELMRSEKMNMKKQEDLPKNELTEIMMSAVEMTKENQRQDKVSLWIAGFVIIGTAMIVYGCGYANIGGSLFIGALVAIGVVGAYLFYKNKDDKEGRHVYGFFMLVGLAITINILHILNVDSYLVVWLMFSLLCCFIGRTYR